MGWQGMGQQAASAAVSARSADFNQAAATAEQLAQVLNSYANDLENLQTQARALQTTYDQQVAGVKAMQALTGASSMPSAPNAGLLSNNIQQIGSATAGRAAQLTAEAKTRAQAAAAAISALAQMPFTAVSATRQGVAGLALSQVGYAEQPLGSNNVPRYFGWTNPGGNPNTNPWCSVFASWVLNKSGVPVSNTPASGMLAQWAQQNTSLMPATAHAQPGDMVFYGSGPSASEHVGLVTAVRPDGQVQTVEGNTQNQVSFYNWHTSAIDADPEAQGRLHLYAIGAPATG